MTQHTPGPWGLSEYGQIINPASTSLWSSIISVTGGVSVPSPATAESNANRDLIVQAPAMLEALQRAAQWLEMAYAVTLDEAYAVESRKAKTVIATAGGE